MIKIPFSLFFILLSLYSCQKKGNAVKNYSIGMQSVSLTNNEILLSLDSTSFLYDLKIANELILFLDNKNDRVLRGYFLNDFSTPLFDSISEHGEDKLEKPSFTKNIQSIKKDKDKIFYIDNNLYYKYLLVNKDKELEIHTLKKFNQNNIYSTNFNITQNNIYAVPVNRETNELYYIFNPTNGYQWVKTNASLIKILKNKTWAYTNTICLNENSNSVVSAFRFTNTISFYNLNGELKVVVNCGDSIIKPEVSSIYDNINVERSIKCFTYICGTENYVYCLYDGSSNFSALSKIYVFQWDGKHITTLQTDNNLRAIAVDNEDKYIMAISSNNKNGQDIIKYHL